MPQVETSLISYLVPGKDSFWRWSADGEAIVWSDGSTIVLRDELLEIFSRLAFNGLPPFGSLVLLLAACRSNWTAVHFEASRAFYTRCLEQSIHSNATRIVSHRIGHGLRKVFERLDAVAALPAELRESTSAKAVLAEVVFEKAEMQLKPAESMRLAAAFSEGLSIDALLNVVSADVSDRQAASELDALEAGLAQLDPEQLALRRRTGLDRLVEPADLKLPLAERVHQLVFQLREDTELSGLARLTQNLMAAVNVPRRLASPEDLALGGISDLSNRGPIDRLLVSELAHDDLTLAVRIALNEALYIRREAPARDPRQRRVILVDSGIRTWGVSRVFATAAALALAATASPGAQLAVFRADGDQVIPLDLATKSGLIEHLEALTPHPHPGAALPHLAKELAQEDLSTDLIIITHEDALDDAEFGRCLSDELAAVCYVSTVNRDGDFRLWQISARGRKLICQAELSLDDLFKTAPDKAVTPLVERRGDRELPLILSIEPFPLRLPHVLDPRLARASELSGLIGVSSDGRLLQWSSAVSGALQLTDTVPTGRLVDILIDSDQNIVHVCAVDHRKNRMTIVHAALDTKRCTRDEFPCNNPLKACFDRGTILLIYRKEVHAITPGGAHRCAPLKLSLGTRWHSGRYFTDAHSVFAVSFDGSDLRFERIGENNRLAWFERAGHDGPWSLSDDGSVFDGAGQRVAPTKSSSLPGMRFLGVSADGARIAAAAMRNQRTVFVLDLNGASTWRGVQGSAQRELVGPQLDWSLSSGVNVRKHFSCIAVGKGGNLTLISLNRSLAFMLNEDGNLILAGLGQPTDPGRQKIAFQPATPPPGCRYDLKCATWKDGSRAYLDSRGMLHLKSSDSRMPELTLILCIQPVSGWTSVGATFGWRYFVGDAPTTTGAHVYELIRQFVSRLR